MIPLSRALQLDEKARRDRAWADGFSSGLVAGFILTVAGAAFAWWFWSLP